MGYAHIKNWIIRLPLLLIKYLVADKDGYVFLPVVRGPARGLYFRVNTFTNISIADIFGRYEAEQLRFLNKIIPPGSCVWDCGAYVGYYTAFFSRLVGKEGKVVAFEPDPRNLQQLKLNMIRNRIFNVKYVSAAIGESREEIDFILSDNTNSHVPGTYVGKDISSYRAIERNDGMIKVRSISLDEAHCVLGLEAPYFIKLDIDGAEIMALKNMEYIATKLRPMIVLELHNPECDKQAWLFSRKYNYRLFSLKGGCFEIKKCEDTHGHVFFLPEEKRFLLKL